MNPHIACCCGGPNLQCCGLSDIALPPLGSPGTLSYAITYALTDNAEWRASEPPVAERVASGGGSTSFTQRCGNTVPSLVSIGPQLVLIGEYDPPGPSEFAIRQSTAASYLPLDSGRPTGGLSFGASVRAQFDINDFPPFTDPRGWRSIGPRFSIQFSINPLTGDTFVEDDGGWAGGPPSLSVVTGPGGVVRGGTLTLNGARVDGNGDTIANVSGSLTVVLDAIGRCPPGTLLQPPGSHSLVPPSDPAVQRLLEQQARGGGCRGCNE